MKCVILMCYKEVIAQWAYGVTCWEIFSGGKIPYPGIQLVNLPLLLAEGYRMERPSNSACSDKMCVILLSLSSLIFPSLVPLYSLPPSLPSLLPLLFTPSPLSPP